MVWELPQLRRCRDSRFDPRLPFELASSCLRHGIAVVRLCDCAIAIQIHFEAFLCRANSIQNGDHLDLLSVQKDVSCPHGRFVLFQDGPGSTTE